jgi:hypothetical protein
MNKDLQMFGMSREEIKEQYMESLTARHSGLEMVVMGILSDCQELLAMTKGTGTAEFAAENIRKQMNVAKYILCEMMDSKERV